MTTQSRPITTNDYFQPTDAIILSYDKALLQWEQYSNQITGKTKIKLTRSICLQPTLAYNMFHIRVRGTIKWRIHVAYLITSERNRNNSACISIAESVTIPNVTVYFLFCLFSQAIADKSVTRMYIFTFSLAEDTIKVRSFSQILIKLA